MSMVLTSTPVVGLPALTGWAQVVHNHSGHLVCAYAVSGQNAHNLGRDLADLISSTELPDAVALHQLILDLLARTRKAGSTLQFAAVLQANGRLVVGAHQGQVLYHRAGATRALVQAEAEPQLLEGKLLPETTLIALTHQATVNSELLTQQLTQGWDTDTIVTSLLPTLHDQTDSALSALAFVTVSGEAAAPSLPPLAFDSEAASEIYADETEVEEPMTAVPDGQPMLRHSLAASRRETGAQLPSKPITIAWTQVVTSLKKTVLGIWAVSRQFTRFFQTASQTWQQTLPKAKKQIIILSLTAAIIMAVILGSLIWYIHSKKSANPATAKQTAAANGNSTAAQSQPQELPVFFDLRLTEPNFLATRVTVSGSTAYFTDLENKKIIQLDLAKKQSSVLPLGALSKIADLSFSDHYLYLLGSGLNRWDTQSPTAAPQPAKNLKAEGDSDRDGTLLGSFGSYLYVLNPTKRNIFRFSIDKQDKVSDPIGWLVNKKGLDFTQLISLAIDGDVWLTDKTGHIFKFTQGQLADWQLNGVKTAPDSPIYAVTNDSLTKLYLLEPNRHRLLVVDKSGQLVKEIESPTLAAVTSFGVSETLQKAFAVSGSTVYELAL